MFCLFGRSRVLAVKTVGKQVFESSSSVRKELDKHDGLSQFQKQSIIDQFVDEEFKTMKIKKVTKEYSAPEFVRDLYSLIKNDKENFSDLAFMKKQPRLEKSGKPKVSPKTGRQSMHWVSNI